MYCDIMCHKSWIMVVEFYFRTWIFRPYNQVAKKNRFRYYFSFNSKYPMIIEDMRLLLCCCIWDNSETKVLNLLIMCIIYV